MPHLDQPAAQMRRLPQDPRGGKFSQKASIKAGSAHQSAASHDVDDFDRQGMSGKPHANPNEVISQYQQLGRGLKKNEDFRKVAQKIAEIAEMAEQTVVKEAGDWFDEHTIRRNMKEMKGYAGAFSKIAEEMDMMYQRATALYDDMGNVLGRYFEIANLSEDDARKFGKRIGGSDDLQQGYPRADRGAKNMAASGQAGWTEQGAPDEPPESDFYGAGDESDRMDALENEQDDHLEADYEDRQSGDVEEQERQDPDDEEVNDRDDDGRHWGEDVVERNRRKAAERFGRKDLGEQDDDDFALTRQAEKDRTAEPFDSKFRDEGGGYAPDDPAPYGTDTTVGVKFPKPEDDEEIEEGRGLALPGSQSYKDNFKTQGVEENVRWTSGTACPGCGGKRLKESILCRKCLRKALPEVAERLLGKKRLLERVLRTINHKAVLKREGVKSVKGAKKALVREAINLVAQKLLENVVVSIKEADDATTREFQLRQIVGQHQAGNFAGQKIDAMTARAILTVYDALSPENRKKYLMMPVTKMASFAFKMVR